MDTATTLLVVIGVLIAIAGLIWVVAGYRRTELLKRKFGREYERTFEEAGRRGGESDLVERTKRVADLDIHPLSADQRDRFTERWRRTQASFVDDPVRAVREADTLVDEVMRARGYPVSDFDHRAADISVDHPGFVEHYREAHAIAIAAERGTVRTEDLRKATIHYRDLFEDLLSPAA